MTDDPAHSGGAPLSGWVLTGVGALAGAAAGMAQLVALVAVGLDGSGAGTATTAVLVSGMLLVAGAVVAALGVRRLGVSTTLRCAGAGLLVAVSGYAALWVAAIIAGRLSS